MAFGDVLVHLDNGPRSSVRLALARSLAERFGARLVGLFAERAPPIRVGVVATWPSAEYVAAADSAWSAFTAATADLGPRAVWVDCNRGGEVEVVSRTIDIARTSDLIVIGQTEEEGARVPSDFAERLILESGRPVLVIPHSGTYGGVGERPLFAWTAARAAARAMADALPLVMPGADALVLTAAEPSTALDEASERVLGHLAAHGIEARFSSVVVEEVKLMDTLLNRAADHSADLLAIGAFENAGFPFVGRGSGTRYVLRHMTLPVLFSH